MIQSQVEYQSVDASPVKSFFVTMLTRDIRLEEAILDLLDNCVDGILRSSRNIGPKPYSHYKADIEFTSQSFTITDNCGGIPWSLHEYAFRMGRAPDRPDDPPGTVGVYGIGMKRAIFKIGEQCLISTKHAEDQYEVEITPEWIRDELRWHIPVRPGRVTDNRDGTTIYVTDLHSGIARTFGEGTKSFELELRRMISTHYAYIIDKGFEVTVNGDRVNPRTTKILYDRRTTAGSDAIKPYVFKGEYDGVEVFLAVGFTRPIPSSNEVLDGQEFTRHSSIDAGWTILCNDRAVLHSDRTVLTGWGEAGVPRYHTQFIAISGIVEFKSKDPRSLPTTTTKRGVDASSPIYLQIKNKMREGMKVFTDYTNKWKGRADESETQMSKAVTLDLGELKGESSNLTFRQTRSLANGEQYKPKLPTPPTLARTKRRITFVKELAHIKTVAEYLDDPDMRPSEVGELCFDAVYDEASA